MMEASVEIALIGMVSSVFSAAFAAAAVYFGQRNANRLAEHGKTLHDVESKVDGQLTEVVALKQAVAHAAGGAEERERHNGGHEKDNKAQQDRIEETAEDIQHRVANIEDAVVVENKGKIVPE